MSPDEINAMFGLVLVLTLLVATFFIGGALERRHYASIRQREQNYRNFLAINFSHLSPDWQIESTELARGSIVISVDYFKRFVALLKAIFGGRLTTYEPLLDRARREALLRMIEDAKSKGCNAVINVRLETSRLANATSGNRERLAGVEILAYGTAIRTRPGVD